MGALGAVSDGMHYGWTAPVLPILRNTTTSPIEISETDELWLETIYVIGTVFGLPITMYSVDKFGRKPTILLSAGQHLITWMLIASANSVEYLYIARFIAGVAGNIAFISVPMYIGEIADQQIRGRLSGNIFIMMLLGLVVVYSVAPFLTLLQTATIPAAFVAIQLLSFSWMPESPYYLLVKGNKKGALESLQRLRSQEDVNMELEEILLAVKRQRTQRAHPTELLSSNRKALTIMVVLNMCQQLCGYTVMLMNLHTILADASTIVPPSTAGIMFATVMLISSTVSNLLVDKAGRKILLMSSSLLSGVALLALSVYLTLKNSGVDVARYNWVPVVSVMFYAAVFKFGMGLIPIIMTAELFPTSAKAVCMTISDSSFTVFSFVSIAIYDQLTHNFGMQWTFFVYSAFCVFACTFTAFYIPETKGLTLDEIQHVLKGTKPIDREEN